MRALRTATLIALATTAALALGACAERTGPAWASNGHAANVPAATPNGPAVSCIPIVQIQQSQVRDDWTIDFRMAGNKWYRNTLPNRCGSLGFERAFSYATSLPQLCNVDIIRVFPQGGVPRGPLNACGLGQFQPVTLAKETK
jgi:hypothetical protein